MKQYTVNEIFGPTLQGEGARKGTVNFWLRFAACNLTCRREVEGFDCDTDFSGGRKMTAQDIVETLNALNQQPYPVRWVVCSGGEPTLQLDDELCLALEDAGYHIAVETNGTNELPPKGVDWVSCSPKTAEHTLRVGGVDELRYVRAVGQELPKPQLKASHYYISPAFEPDGSLKQETLDWCVKLCLENPRWALSIQDHKTYGWR